MGIDAMNIKNKSLVLVLGAGASKEVNLPIGNELKHKIAQRLYFKFDEFGHSLKSGNRDLIQAFQISSMRSDGTLGDITPLLEVSKLIHDAMPLAISIDNFIDSHRNDDRVSFCGKLAIAQCILEAEAKSTIYVNPSNIYNKLNFSDVENTWFNAFFQQLTENCHIEDLSSRLKDVAVISFNYDRCLEHYLYLAFQSYYGISASESAQLLASLEIHHPYGKVGALPWMTQSNERIAFGATPNHQQLIEITKLLRTFTEGTNPSVSDIKTIRDTVAGAERLLFLGFAFHRLNLDLLFSGQPSNTKKVFATALNISGSNCQQIKNELSEKAKHPQDFIYIRNDLNCSQLFSEYSRSLSLTQ
jgi:hypothetical protein